MNEFANFPALNLETVRRLADEAGFEFHERFEGEFCGSIEMLQRFDELAKASAYNVFVPNYDWNSHWDSPEKAVTEGQKYGDYPEGYDFTMVRLVVVARSAYRIIGGVPVLTSTAFPEETNPQAKGGLSDEPR